MSDHFKSPLTPPTPSPKIEYMFALTPQPAPPQSLADIVREETDDGRLIVRFFIDLMQGSMENAKPCHRLDAARQLLSLGFSQANAFIAAHSSPVSRSREGGNLALSQNSLHHDLSALICEETGNGRAAVRFLVDVMQGNLQDFKPHHRLSAAKELLRRGFDAPTTEPEAVSDTCDNPHLHDPDGIYYRDRDGNWQRDNARSPVLAPDGISHPKAEQPATAFEHLVDSHQYEQECDPFYFGSYDEDDYRRECYCQIPNNKTDIYSDSEPPSHDWQFHQELYPDLSEGPSQERRPLLSPAPGPARISLGKRGIDSVTADHYQHVDNLCRSP